METQTKRIIDPIRSAEMTKESIQDAMAKAKDQMGFMSGSYVDGYEFGLKIALSTLETFFDELKDK